MEKIVGNTLLSRRGGVMKKEYLRLENAYKIFKTKSIGAPLQETIAVNNVNLSIYKGETLALVGESGSGKTTLGKGILNIEPLSSGEIFVDGYEKSLKELNEKERREVYNKMQIIFQDPYSSLNPRLSALEIVMEPLYRENKETARKKALDMLNFVGISNEEANKLSTAFSGGQRQRIGIARAVVGRPDFILCDEPTSALDASTQAQVINLLKDLQKEFQLTYLFISHNLSVVRYIADRVAVMYRGSLVELGNVDQVMNNPQHEYTKRLLEATPILNPKKAREMFENHQVAEEDIVLCENCSFEEVEDGHFVRKQA